MLWIIAAILSAFFAGLTSILAKCGIKKTDSDLATALRTVVVLIFSWVMVFVVGSAGTITDISARSLIFLILSGLATGASWICYFKALSMGDINKVVPIDEFTSYGSAVVQEGEEDYLLAGEEVAYELGLYSMTVGDIEVYSLGGGQIGAILPTVAMHSESLGLRGTFVIDRQHAASFAITSLRAANRIFGLENGADMLLVKVADGASYAGVANELRRTLGEQFKVTLREEKNEGFYAIMRYEKWAIFFVSLLVLVVASLSIIGTVIMLVIEKRDERTTLLSIGADNRFIRGIFVREGLLIAGVGGVIGLVVGVAVTLAQQHFGFVKMPNGNFLIENYPVELQAMDLLVIFVVFVAVALSVSIVATSTMIKKR